ncbi:MAG TPA: hypothetical protein VEV39_08185 [Gemmatimonadales bacterium]|nr:hypothetical protein [Gemmatimonadales bacterium]
MRTLSSLCAGAALAAGVLSGACSSTLAPPAAIYVNVVDTATLYAATGTPVGTPSAYDIEDTVTGARVRTDTTPIFDFLFDIVGSQAKFYPPGALPGLARTAALQYAGSFDGTTTAPGPGWNDSTALDIDSGSVILVRSRQVSCAVGIVFEYAKVQILSIDTVARTTTFQILNNRNCGYRDLTPGYPKH